MTVVIRGARIWDGVGDRASSGPRCIVVEEGRIARIEPDAEPGRAADTESVGATTQIDLSGHFLMPGLIDAHVHMGLDPAIKTPAEQLAVSADERRARMDERAWAMAAAGITTARDLGWGDYSELDLRDRIARGEVPGPRLVCAGQPLTRPDGHCHFWGGGADDAAAQLAVVERQLEHGVDWIKVMATGGVFTPGSDARSAQFGEAEITAVCRRAAEAGRLVAAHCHGSTGIRNAARGGVRTIEHCSFAGKQGFGADFDATVVADLVDANAWVSPTVNLGWGRRLTDEHGRMTAFFERMSEVMHALRRAGVPLIASTDAGIPGVAHHRLAEGLLAFQRFAGLSSVDLLRSATSTSAEGLGLANTIGRVAEGFEADLMAVRRDPTLDPTTLLAPAWVMTRGRVVPELPPPAPPNP